MAPLLRISPNNIPTHIIQRVNNRQVYFGSDDNHVAYAGWIKKKRREGRLDGGNMRFNFTLYSDPNYFIIFEDWWVDWALQTFNNNSRKYAL